MNDKLLYEPKHLIALNKYIQNKYTNSFWRKIINKFKI